MELKTAEAEPATAVAWQTTDTEVSAQTAPRDSGQRVLKPGYKQTEVGLIPEDWEVKTLKELAAIQRGASPRPIDSPIWYDRASTVGWVRISDVTKSDGKQLKGTEDYLSDKGIANSRFLPAGSLIMSICATVGIPVITKIDSCIHDGFVGFTRLKFVDQEFLYYKLKEQEPAFRSMGQTGSQSNLNTDLVRDRPVALPPLPEQRAIAAALSDVDALLAKLDALIAKKRDLKQAAMQQLLSGKQRLPGFSGEWEVKRFGDIATPRKDRLDPRKAGTQEFCIELEHIEQGAGRLLGSASTGDQSSLKSIFQAGDVLFGKLRAYLRKYWLADREGVCSTEIWALMAHRRLVTPEFSLVFANKGAIGRALVG